MLSTEVYYRDDSWWGSVVARDRFGHVVQRLVAIRCTEADVARRVAHEALIKERNKHNEA